MLNSLAMV